MGMQACMCADMVSDGERGCAGMTHHVCVCVCVCVCVHAQMRKGVCVW